MTTAMYMIETRDAYGWHALKESTILTGFRMGPVLYAARSAAEEQRLKMIHVAGWASDRVRVVSTHRLHAAGLRETSR